MELNKTDKIKQLVRNSFVVFDNLMTKFRESFGESFVSVGSGPVFGKVKDYSNENFDCKMVYLKPEKSKDLLLEGMEKFTRKDSTGLTDMKEGSKINDYVLTKIRESSDNAFCSFSTIEIRPRKDLDEGFLEAIMTMKTLSSREKLKSFNDPDELLEMIKKSAKKVLSDPETAWVRQIMCFSYQNLSINLTFRTGYDVRTESIYMIDSKQDVFNNVIISDIRKDTDDVLNLSDVYSIDELPFFIMDLDW